MKYKSSWPKLCHENKWDNGYKDGCDIWTMVTFYRSTSYWSNLHSKIGPKMLSSLFLCLPVYQLRVTKNKKKKKKIPICQYFSSVQWNPWTPPKPTPKFPHTLYTCSIKIGSVQLITLYISWMAVSAIFFRYLPSENAETGNQLYIRWYHFHAEKFTIAFIYQHADFKHVTWTHYSKPNITLWFPNLLMLD